MSTISVKRPKISCTTISAGGRVVTKKISLVSPYSDPVLSTCSPGKVCDVNPVHEVTAAHNVDEALFDTQTSSSWAQIQDSLWQTYHKSRVPDQVECCVCHIALDIEFVKCQDCGPFAFFCRICCDNVHGGSQQFLLHKPKLWTDSGYKDYHIDILLDRPDHTCSKSGRGGLLVFDEKGRIHHCTLVRCQCDKEESITLMRHNLWSASVKQPKVAFHMELMNWLEFLLLESAVSLQAACLAIRWKNGFTDSEYNTLYNHLVGEPIEEYLLFQNRLREFPVASDESDAVDGLPCPACPKETGKLFISLDGNFGLVRKQNGGHSQFGPRNGTKLFTEQSDIDSFVQRNDEKVPTNKECNSFQAGSLLRAKNKSVKLDQKGVFGAACRHGIPKIMMSMKEGERLAYPVFALNSLLDQVKGKDVKLHVLYDIACMLDSHLKRTNQAGNYGTISLALPIFHAYGHKSSCQIRYSCRWLDGFGLTDGEVMERLWSFLRPFANSTKEMTPSHRIDRLTDALLHYARKKRHEIDALLCRNMDKAKYLVNCCTQELEAIKFTHNVSDENIKEWLQCEQQRAKTQSGKKRVSGSRDTRQELLAKLHAQAVEYAFVSTLRRKYSSGQAIAKRICRAITKVSKNMRALLALYNQDQESTALEWKQVCNPEDDIYKNHDNADQIPDTCSREQKQKAIDLYLYRVRAQEEIVMTREEMVNCLKWYSSQTSYLTSEITTCTTATSRGEIDTMFQKRRMAISAYYRAKLLFSRHLSGVDIPLCEVLVDSSTINRDVVMEEDLIDNLEHDDVDTEEHITDI